MPVPASPSPPRVDHWPKLETGFGTPSTSSKPRRSKHKKHHEHHGKSSSRYAAPLTWKEQLVQLLAILVTAAVVYTVTVLAIGWVEEARRPFCASEEPVQDGCIPCPPNGHCKEGELSCFPGFRRQGKSCLPDKQIDQIAQKLAMSVESNVCRIAGQALCGDEKIIWVTEDQIWDPSKDTKLGLDAENVWLVHEKALRLVGDKLNVRTDDFGTREYQCPTETAKRYRPLSCCIRQGLKDNIYGVLLSAFIVVSLAVYILRSLHHRKLLARAEELYLQVCEVLGEKALEASDQSKWVVASRLRDHLLLPTERKLGALWSQVEGMVQEDSRIDQYPRVVNGESRIVWEWQGMYLHKLRREGACYWMQRAQGKQQNEVL